MNRQAGLVCFLLVFFAGFVHSSIAQTRSMVKPCIADGPSLKETVEYINRNMADSKSPTYDDQGKRYIEVNASEYKVSFFSGREQVSSHVKYLTCETEAVVDGKGYDPPMHYVSLWCKQQYPGCFSGQRWNGANRDLKDTSQSGISFYYLAEDMDERLARALSHLVVLLQQMYKSDPANVTDPFAPK